MWIGQMNSWNKNANVMVLFRDGIRESYFRPLRVI